MSKAEALAELNKELLLVYLGGSAGQALSALIDNVRRADPEATASDIQLAITRNAQSKQTDHVPAVAEATAWLAECDWTEQKARLIGAGWAAEEADHIIAGIRKAATTIDLKPTENAA